MTVAFGTTAPAESVTVPRRVPLTVWARVAAAKVRTITIIPVDMRINDLNFASIMRYLSGVTWVGDWESAIRILYVFGRKSKFSLSI